MNKFTIEGLQSIVMDQSSQIKSLRQQLASRDAEIAELKRKLNDPVLLSEWQQLEKERDQLSERVKMLRDAIKYSKHQCESIRTWGGMSWVYHPLQAGRIFNRCEEALAATEPRSTK